VFIEIPVGSYIPLIHWTGEDGLPAEPGPERNEAGVGATDDVRRSGLPAPRTGLRQIIRQRGWAALAVAACVLGAAVIGYLRQRERRPQAPSTVISAPMFTPISSTSDLESTPSISPDGQRVAYVHRMPDGRKLVALWSGSQASPILIGDPSTSYSRPA